MSWSESWWVTRNIVKSIQKGKTTSAQTVTINRVDTTRSIVLSVSKGSAGYVATKSSFNGTMNVNGNNSSYIASIIGTRAGNWSMNGTMNGDNGTDLTVKQYSATLTSPTILYCDGPVEWQVIEFY